jgi:hypothetical protein
MKPKSNKKNQNQNLTTNQTEDIFLQGDFGSQILESFDHELLQMLDDYDFDENCSQIP